jgi:hypothetical protein
MLAQFSLGAKQCLDKTPRRQLLLEEPLHWEVV